VIERMLMNRFVRAPLVALLLWCAIPAAAQQPPLPPPPDGRQMVPSDILTQVFFINPKGTNTFGTGFMIFVDDREYLVTASHVVEKFTGILEVSRYKKWEEQPATMVGSALPKADIAVLAFKSAFSPSSFTPVSLYTIDGTFVSERLFFAGFPLGMSTWAKRANSGYPVAFVKSEVIAGFKSDKNDITDGLFLDAINNHGFSGGPVVTGGSPVQVVGVVVSYHGDVPSEVVGPMDLTLWTPHPTNRLD
jgi:S1-C subfamily serine protease